LADTALVVLVPEAEAAVSSVRARFDPSAQLGVPAHVTLLFPFMPLGAVSASVLASLHELFAGFASFTVSFAAVRRWPQEAYLAPEPAAPFVALTRGIATRFPGYPPYGGRHAEIVPHLTVAQGSAAAAERGAEEVSAVLAATGPVRVACTAATMLENSSGAWRALHTFSLAQRVV
jgi:2'-5' RNA ligase